MDPAYQQIIRRRLELPLHDGSDKRATLEGAVRRHVESGDTLYLFDPRRYFLGDFA